MLHPSSTRPGAPDLFGGSPPRPSPRARHRGRAARRQGLARGGRGGSPERGPARPTACVAEGELQTSRANTGLTSSHPLVAR